MVLAATRRLCEAERGTREGPRSAPQSLRVAVNPGYRPINFSITYSSSSS